MASTVRSLVRGQSDHEDLVVQLRARNEPTREARVAGTQQDPTAVAGTLHGPPTRCSCCSCAWPADQG